MGKKTVSVGKKTFDVGKNTIDVGKKKQEKRQAPSRRDQWTLLVRMPGTTLPCRQYSQSVERHIKWTLLLTQRRGREGGREGETDRQTETDRQRQRQTDRHRQTGRNRDRDRQTDRQRQRLRDPPPHTHTYTHTQIRTSTCGSSSLTCTEVVVMQPTSFDYQPLWQNQARFASWPRRDTSPLNRPPSLYFPEVIPISIPPAR